MAIIHLALVGYGIVFQGAKVWQALENMVAILMITKFTLLLFYYFIRSFKLICLLKKIQIVFIIMGFQPFFILN